MNGKELLRRTFALMLTLVMTLSMSVFAFEDSYAVTDEDGRSAADVQEEGTDNGNVQADEAASERYSSRDGLACCSPRLPQGGNDRLLIIKAAFAGIRGITKAALCSSGGSDPPG